jgi:hypothetical protein
MAAATWSNPLFSPQEGIVSRIVSMLPYQDVAAFEKHLDRLTAACLVHRAHETIFAEVQELHMLLKRMRRHLAEEQVARTVEQLETSVKQRQELRGAE